MSIKLFDYQKESIKARKCIIDKRTEKQQTLQSFNSALNTEENYMEMNEFVHDAFLACLESLKNVNKTI